MIEGTNVSDYVTDPRANVLNIGPVKGFKRYDLNVIEMDGKKRYSFLDVTWGMISDIDLGTEWVRCIGEWRFYVGILKFLISNRYVSGKLCYESEDGVRVGMEGEFCLVCASNVEWISGDFNMIPFAIKDDNKIDLIYYIIFYKEVI